MNNINEIIQSSSETGNGSGLRFIPAQWSDEGEVVGYDVTTISDTIDDDLGFTIKIRQTNDETSYESSWVVQVVSSCGESPEIPCDSLIEAYKTTMMWYTGFCEGRVIQSELDAVKITHMMLENNVNPEFLGIDEDSMNDCVEVDDTLNSKSNNTTIINDEFITIPNSNTEGNVTPNKHSIRGVMGWIASLIY